MEQMSFIVPSEAEQIQLIDTMEAESAQTAPFAFSVPQQVMDAFLQYGSNTTNHRQSVATDFMKQMPAENIATHLQKLYHGGNGLEVNAVRYAAWYDAEGIHIARGSRARNVRQVQTLSWTDAADRIGTLMERGQFATALEIAEAPATERKQIATALWYMNRDIAEGHSDLMPTVNAVRGGGFPDEVARLADMLTDPAQSAQINAEMQTFMEAYHADRDVLRFHYHSPEALANSLNELSWARRDYSSDLMKLPAQKGFITEDEINANFIGGSGVSGGKLRIYRFFEGHRDTKERADFLKNEYGTGGRSHALSGSDHSDESHDSKGIRLRKRDCPDVQLSWSQVAGRIDDLIRHDRYLSEAEKESMEANETSSQLETKFEEPELLPNLGRSDSEDTELRANLAQS